MKKAICALCSLLLCVLCICPSFAAQGEYTLTLQMSSCAAVGEPLTVSLLLSVPEGETLEHYAVATQISYDTAVLRLENTAAHEEHQPERQKRPFGPLILLCPHGSLPGRKIDHIGFISTVHGAHLFLSDDSMIPERPSSNWYNQKSPSGFPDGDR